MIMGDTVRTYGALDRRAARLASVLADLGAGPGKPVAIFLPNSIEIFEVAVAAAMLNAPFLPVNWHLKADELAYILADADVAAVVGQAGTDDDLSKALDHHGAGSLRVGAEYERALEAAPPWPGRTAAPGRSSCSTPRAPRRGPRGWSTPAWPTTAVGYGAWRGRWPCGAGHRTTST